MRVPIRHTGIPMHPRPSFTEPNHTTQGREINTYNTNCEVTMNPQSKPKRGTKKYRVVQRPDGVIVEFPRYRPAASHQTPEFQSKPHRAILVCPNLFIREMEGSKPGRTMYQLVGDKMFESNIGGDSGAIERGRGGYHDLATQQHIQRDTETHTSKRQDDLSLAAIDRFLREPAPWSPYSTREEQIWLE
ncbi:uncharacterized protein SETTUDRAFT_154267 [Exserohilum turcica Et28A]|uniref:Uncharacterized protein n=1 Tax=Exserohilum turcicum (strain 28A) TaxID=671987 RepID=R0II12_EXST2|nr:uncharacterized protein SETTUDRAFT_154267 [Exserohilum turcica Et28A]EOA84596.1 hypothetical protein SETTUDRAFT_154267 [Exserohilum turcica Et28A]